MFADDARFTLSSCDPALKQSKLNSDLVEVQTWLQANKLSLNVKKPSVIIGTHNRLDNLNHRFDTLSREPGMSGIPGNRAGLVVI